MPAPLELEAFCQNEYRPLIGMLTLYTGDPEVARDLAQEALARLCANWGRVRRMEAPGPWLHRVAINLANSHFRRALAERRASHRLQAQTDRPVAAAAEPSAAGAVRAALAALPPRQRTAVVLRYFLDLDVYDTARRMECGEGTVKKLTQRALQALRSDPRLEGWLEETDVP